MKITQPQLARASDLGEHHRAARAMASWADKQPGAKDFTIEVSRQGAPIRMVVSGAELLALAVNVGKRIEQQLKGYDIEIDDGDEA